MRYFVALSISTVLTAHFLLHLIHAKRVIGPGVDFVLGFCGGLVMACLIVGVLGVGAVVERWGKRA